MIGLNGNGEISAGTAGGSLALSGGISSLSPSGTDTLTLGGTSTGNTVSGVIADGTASSFIAVTKTDGGTWALTGPNTYTGATTVSGGTLDVNGSIASSSGVSVAPGATLGGHGSVGKISGAGLVAPGDPQILTATQVDPSSGVDFAFSLTQSGSPIYSNAGASGNDVLHLTDPSTPLLSALTSANTITVDFSGATLSLGQTYLGGFFTDAVVPDATVNQATFDYTGLNGASVQYEGLVTEPSAAYATGTVTNGEVMEFQVTPEPGSAALLALGTGAVLGWRRRRR